MPAKKTEYSPSTAQRNTSTLVKGVVQIGDMREDNGGTPFFYASLISSNSRDEEGNPVSNPRGMMIYMGKGLKTGSIISVLLLKRGLAGLYNYIQPDSETVVLEQLNLKREDVPEIPVVEQEENAGMDFWSAIFTLHLIAIA